MARSFFLSNFRKTNDLDTDFHGLKPEGSGFFQKFNLILSVSKLYVCSGSSKS